MNALTLTQPWATLVACGAKHIETRSWSTSYSGPLAIHAAAGLGPLGGKRAFWALENSEPFCSALRSADMPNFDRYPGGYPFGAIVAVCRLVCTKMMNTRNLSRGWYGVEGADWPLTDQERAFGNYAPGRYAWLLADIQELPEPIPARGQLGLWEVGGKFRELDTLTQEVTDARDL